MTRAITGFWFGLIAGILLYTLVAFWAGTLAGNEAFGNIFVAFWIAILGGLLLILHGAFKQ